MDQQKKAGGVSAGIIVAIVAIVAVAAAFLFGFINIDQTKETKMPEVAVQGGQAPEFDVKTADVDVGTKTETLDVPTVGTRKEAVDVPTVDVKPAN